MIDTTSIKTNNENLVYSETISTTSDLSEPISITFDLSEPTSITSDLSEKNIEWQKKNKENKENKGDKNMEKILEIYRKDMIKTIEKICDENIKEIRKNSELGQIYTKVLEYSQKKIKEAYPDNFDIMEDKIYISFDNDDKIQKEINKEISKTEQAIESLDDTLKAVKALLYITETYEQKMDILKRYKILDEDGLLV